METDTRIYARHGKLRDLIDEAAVSHGEVVFVSPKTGERLKRTTKGQQVLYGYIRADGSLNLLGPHAQTRNETLRRWLEKHISTQGEKAFALYEQKGKEVLLDKNGRPLKMKGGGNRHVSKLAIPSTSKQQRAILYKQGKRSRNIEFAYHFHDRAQLLTKLAVEPIRPDGRVVSLNLTGDTVADSMRSIVLDKSLKRLKKWERVFYEWIVIYRDPDTGEKITLPGRGREIPYGLVVTDVRENDPLHPRHFRARLSRVAGLAVAVGHDVRTALASNGKRFTSLFKMRQLEDSYTGLVKKAEKQEDDKRADALQGTLDRIKRPWKLGPLAHTLTPLIPEGKNGQQIARIPDALTIKIRFVIEEDIGAKRLAFQNTKKRKKTKGQKHGRTYRR